MLRVLTSCGLAALTASAVWIAIARAVDRRAGLDTGLRGRVRRATTSSCRCCSRSACCCSCSRSAVHYALLALEAVRDAERRRFELEVLTREAELRALRAQLNPHFLYNSLNSISALDRRRSGRRAADVPAARRFPAEHVERERTATRFRSPTSWRWPIAFSASSRSASERGCRWSGASIRPRRSAACRRCILQPLVENAVVHGIAGLLEGGVIRLDISRRNGSLSIAIENPRDGDAPDAVTRGVGLDNVRRRLAVMFGRGRAARDACRAGSFRAQLDLPWSAND